MRAERTYVFSLLAALGLLASCTQNHKSTGRAYMPDMAYAQSYETYSTNPNFKDGLTAREPVAGTIPRGMFSSTGNDSSAEAAHFSYLAKRYFTNTPDGYELAGTELKNPIPLTDDVLKQGEKTYTIYCAVCHGATGDGKGTIVQSGAFPPVPAYKERLPTINEGKMFHAVTFGKNLMGSYSSQVSAEDMWKVIYYIQKLTETGQFAKQPATATQDTVAVK